MDELTLPNKTIEKLFEHQDSKKKNLDATITAQWRIIDGLKRDMTSLVDRMQDLGRRDPSAPEPPPPHY